MKIITTLDNFKAKFNSILTIGTFDGVHIGHKKILDKVVYEAQKSNLQSMVLTFFPHPRMVLKQDNEIKLLNTIDEKSALIEHTNVDFLIIHPFNKEFSQLSAEEFVKTLLVDKLNVKKIIIGHDHRFGKDRLADINDLIFFGEKYNFEVEQISAKEINLIAISSTKIRTALQEANIAKANSYLGYNYTISGTVITGNKLGRTIGFPTANIKIDQEYKLLPKNGVYIVRIYIKNSWHQGIMNIGNRPTVDGKNTTIEVYILNFDASIYDEKISIEILDFIRNEKKFENLDFLKNQLEIDKQKAIAFFKS